MVKIAHIHVADKKNKGDYGIVLAAQDFFKETFKKLKIIDFPIEVLQSFKKDEIKKINLSDVVIIGGGGIFYKYFLPFSKEVIDAIKIPIVIFGAGYIREVGASRLSKQEKDSLVYLNKKASLIGVRDYYTKSFLVKNKIPVSKIDIIGDSAIFLKETKIAGFENAKKKKLGVNLNYSGWLGFGDWKKEILDAYKEVIKYFEAKYDAEIYYLVHHPGEYDILKELDCPNMKIIDLSIKKQKYVYGRLDLIVGMMLHSCVMSFGALTPEINVVYDIRNKNFAKFIGCKELAISLDDLSNGKLLKTVKRVINNHADYKEKFKKKKSQILKKHQNYLDKIKLIIS